MSNSFAETLHNIQHGVPLDLSDEEERVNPDETQDPDAQDQGEKEKGKLDGEPESESKDDQEDQDKDKDKPKKESESPDDQSESGETTDEEAEAEAVKVEIDGKFYSLEEVREWRDSGLRLDDYTKKSMSHAEERKKFLEAQKSRETLASDISQDAGLQQFLAARPEALANLMQNPEATRQMLGNPKAVKDFWVDYDAIRKNPRLAAKLAASEGNISEVDTELRKAQEVDQMETIVSTLEQFVAGVSQHELYQDLGEEAALEVLQYVAGLAGVPENPTHEQQLAGVSKLFSLFFVQQDGEWGIDHRLIQGEFERIKNSRAEAQDTKDDEPDVEKHNKQIDEQLKEPKRPPKTPDGQPPATESETPDIPDTFHGILRALDGHG